MQSITPGCGLNPFDHYYARTALLAAQGKRTQMQRLIGVTIIGLSLVPLLVLVSPKGPHGGLQYVAVAVGIGGLTLAQWWWRRQWPSRTQSWTVVSLGTACIGATCILLVDPVVGLMGSSSLSLVAAYTAFLHSRRVLHLIWVASGAIVVFLGVRVALTDVWLGVAGTLVALLVILSTSALCRIAVELIEPDRLQHPGEIDPLTGLLNRGAFDMHTATMLGSHSRHDDQYLVVVAVGIDDMALLGDMDGNHSTLHARVAVAQAIRETVRHKVPLAHVSDSEFLIADVFKTNDPSPLVNRIRMALTTTPMRLTASIGTACSQLRPLTELPTPQVVDALVALAGTAMNQSKAQGGNRATYAHFPTPTTDPDT